MAKHAERLEPVEGDGQRPPPATHFVIVTGLSGAGKSQAAKVLEDLGYFCLDSARPPGNLPNRLVFNRTIGLRDSWAKAKG